MAGRFSYFLIAGGALVAGMALQGDFEFNPDGSDEARIERRAERAVDRSVDRNVTRSTERETIRNEEVIKRQMADAIAELVRAESSLITARLEDDLPATAMRQAEARRNAARDTVERLSNEVQSSSEDDRAAIRESIRDSVRESVREAVRS